jgi:hypothetical protein
LLDAVTVAEIWNSAFAGSGGGPEGFGVAVAVGFGVGGFAREDEWLRPG